MEQILIALTGVTAIWLTQQSKEEWKRYACLFGMAGQPFWFYSAFQAEQWGIFILCCFYTYSWALGIKNNWFNNKSFSCLFGFHSGICSDGYYQCTRCDHKERYTN